ncbi:hypothetical protein Hdeb2414_s0256g00849751 [Helianthus debilis subsp. tardiflorus]
MGKGYCRGTKFHVGDDMLESEQEIAEHAMKKRARVERLKSLKKRRAVKASSAPTSNISIFAMAITVFFPLSIIFQGRRILCM